MKQRKLNPAYLIWIIAPALLVGTYLVFGLPHIHFNYKHKPSYETSSGRWKTACSYIGVYGGFWTHANTDGTCDWFIFRKTRSARRTVSKAGGRSNG